MFNCKPYEQPIDARGNYGNQQRLLDNPQYRWADSITRSIIADETEQTKTAILASGMTTRSAQGKKSFGAVSADLQLNQYGYLSPHGILTRARHLQALSAKGKRAIPDIKPFQEQALTLGALMNEWSGKNYRAQSPTWEKIVQNIANTPLGRAQIPLPPGFLIGSPPETPSGEIKIAEILKNPVFRSSLSSSDKEGGAAAKTPRPKQLAPVDKMRFIYKSIARTAPALETAFAGMNEDIKRAIMDAKFGGRRKKTKKRRKNKNKKKKKKTKKIKRVKKKKTRKKKKRRHKSRKIN